MICVIPARGGSKRIPRKNIKLFHGKPIIQYSIETALESGLFSRVIVSTDDEKTGQIARENGAEFHRRPDEYAVDDESMGTVDVIAQCLRNIIRPDIVTCALYPCAPLIRPVDLVAGFHHFINSVREYLYVSDNHGNDLGQFYWGLTYSWGLGHEIIHPACVKLIPDIQVVDINTPADWERAEKLYEERYNGTE